jgi:DGQHR domain-containing protein
MKYPCIIFKQRQTENSPTFCMFHAPASEIIKWSTIPRISDDRKGVQREKNDFKVKSISNFFSQDSRNTIPTAIIVTFAAGAFEVEKVDEKSSINSITIKEEDKDKIFIVDGQHRLHGIDSFDPTASIPIVAILDASDEEKAFQFIVINNKVTKVPADHIRALSLNFSGQVNENQDLEQRLKTARLTLHRNIGYVGLADELKDSPFNGLIDLPGKPDQENRSVVPSAIESSIAFIQSKKFKQLTEDDAALEFFLVLWSVIKSEWPDVFNKSSMILKKVGLVSMTKFVTEALDSLSTYSDDPIDFGNSEDLEIGIKKILRFQTSEFWKQEWTTPASDTKAFRDLIENSLKLIQQNIRDKGVWSDGVSLVKNASSA